MQIKLVAPPRAFTMPMLARKVKPKQTREQYLAEIFKHHKTLIAQPKLDGLRCIVYYGTALSRTMLPIPNDYIRRKIATLPTGYDGEIITYHDATCTKSKTFHEVQSDVMSKEGEPNFRFVCFDYAEPNQLEAGFERRYTQITHIQNSVPEWFSDVWLHQYTINSLEAFLFAEDNLLRLNYEGVILRAPYSQYWCGPNRPTIRQGSLMAVTLWLTSEAIITGFEEQFENNNVPTLSAGGRVKRSKALCNLKPRGTLGALIVTDCVTGLTFKIGSGFTDKLGQEIWNNQAHYLSKKVTYKYKPYGVKDLPRQPVFLGIRKDL